MPDGTSSFFQRLEESGLLSESIESCKIELEELSSIEEVSEELVRRNLLTAYQASVASGKETGPLAIGDYVVEGMLGQGGMGLVLRGRHRRMKRQVAIKFLHQSMTDSPDLIARFEREVEAAAKLHHPNVVTAYDAGVHEGSHYLVMQYVDGEDLSQIVKSSGPMDIPDAVDVIRQAALGLGYAHDRGIIHRDIKPGNLLLDSEGVVRILDMGLARMTPSPGDELEGRAHADLTNTGSVMGTIDYMAPEQALDAKSVDYRADIYALGCTLYFLLTSNPPFRNETVMRRLLAHREQPAPRISEYRPGAPRELDDIFATMMAKSPDDRFPSMKHLVVALDSLGLNASGAEQMATQDVPDDGVGGFVGLPGYDASTNSESATLPPAPLNSGEEPSTGVTRRLPVSDVTILETPSNVSALNTLADTEPAPPTGATDTDFTGVGETIINQSQPVSGAAAARGPKSPPLWMLIAPVGLAVVALLAFLMTRPDSAIENDEPSKPGAVAVVPQDNSPPDDRQVPESPKIQSDDRRAAEWVLSVGGSIGIGSADGTRLQVEVRKDLPGGPFVVKKVSIQNSPQVTDDGLVNLRGCTELGAIYAYNTAITDQGLANLTDEGRQPLENLASLFIARTRISDTGLQYLAGSKELLYLDVQSTLVSDGSLLGNFHQLSTLDIVRTKISAEELSTLRGLPLLRKLSVDGRQLEGVGRQHVSSLNKLSELIVQYPRPGFDGAVLSGLEQLTKLELLELSEGQMNKVLWTAVGSVPKLESLYLDGDGVTEASIGMMPALPELKVLTFKNGEKKFSGETIAAAVRRAPALQELVVSHNELDDGDARFLESLTQLTKLTLTDNDIAAATIESLHRKLPDCRIESDHGTFQPTVATMTPDRRAAEAVLKLGGTVWVGSDFQEIDDPTDLPTEQFVVTKIDLSNRKGVDDELLTNFRGLADLQNLILSETSITDRGLAHLTDEGRQPLPSLQRLHLDGTGISQTGLQFLSGSHDLIGLLLDKTATTKGAVLDQFPKLAMLGLGYTEFTANELQLLIPRFPWLNYLTMDGRHMSETMTTALANVPKLRVLKLRDLPSNFDPGILAKLPLLTELYLEADDSTVFDDDFWKVISGLQELRILMCNGVTDQSLAKAPTIPQVEVFIVMSKSVTGEALAKSMSKFPNVKSLWVNYADWTENDTQQLHGLKSLGKIDLTKNSASAEAIKALSAALPNCLIISDHGTFGPQSP